MLIYTNIFQPGKNYTTQQSLHDQLLTATNLNIYSFPKNTQAVLEMEMILPLVIGIILHNQISINCI